MENKVIVVCPVKLKKEQTLQIKKELARILTRTDFSLEVILEPEILGGVKIFMGSKVIDLSLEGKLKQISDSLINA